MMTVQLRLARKLAWHLRNHTDEEISGWSNSVLESWASELGRDLELNDVEEQDA